MYMCSGVVMIFLGILILLSSYYFSLKVFYFEWEMLSWGVLDIHFSFLLDWYSLIFSGFVLMISGNVLIYSDSYMEGDFHKNLFFRLMILFVMSMLLLINISNLVMVLLGWDGLGIISYLLIIYYQSKRSFNCGSLTLLSNRLGDAMFLISLFLLVEYYSWDFYLCMYFFSLNSLLKFIFILSMITKSAQIPFSAWLPAAMAAPTPVSSLVHSSTLVTAGVYLLFRNYFLVMGSDLLLMVSVMTMLMSGGVANYEMDIKKIIALSTLSQLGVMVFSMAIGNLLMCYYHLLMHAMFKALLFLCAGSFIHMLGGYQDIRMMGGLMKNCYFHTLGLFVCSLSLGGFPFLTGFYSKDLIYEYTVGSWGGAMIGIFFLVGVLLTMSYSFRLMGFSFLNFYLGSSVGYVYENLKMSASMIMLYVGANLNGGLFMWFFMGKGFLINLSILSKMGTLIFMISGIYFFNLLVKTKILLDCFSQMVYLVKLSNFFFSKGLGAIFKLYKQGDMGLFEFYGGYGLFGMFNFFSTYFLKGSYDYLLGFIFSMVFGVWLGM
uniref:NADH-ubiquinone oxidoreductase chain 5 n=1 Tax=Pauropus longiramus TaxID=933850 RepID=G9BG46_9MYRI|nr:NADH dehydrogenase subunit 5 [Pauropus longiramus]ADT63084.1 NADH dehydrogenase subunit 5 [Pauropus longiramus]